MSDCIAAIATANGAGGVAVIRISGENALKIAKKMFKAKVGFQPNRMYAGKIEGDGFTDYGFVVYFKAPASFTGEDVIELHCHGGVELSRGILKKALSLGARLADRGEFTKRAFLNGKLTLASAEGVADMINAESLALVRAGSMLYFEKLSLEVNKVQSKLKDVLAALSVEIDYPEEDELGDDLKGISENITEISGEIARLIKSYKTGKKVKNGVTVAICGKPNAGKSSLLNALLGYDKALVSSEAGTTRDAVEGETEFNGIKYNFIDTAGLREKAGTVESMGIERAKNIIATADIILSVYDKEGEVSLPEKVNGTVVKVFNKCDIFKPFGAYRAAVSAKTGEGLEELKKLIAATGAGEYSADAAYVVEERHYAALLRAYESLVSAGNNIFSVTADLTAVDLREAWEALGEITGETASEEIVNTIFSKFCVGK